jgi:DNA-binding CsgD family transcriptional regulator
MTMAQAHDVCLSCTRRCLKHERAVTALQEVLAAYRRQEASALQSSAQQIRAQLMPLIDSLRAHVQPAGQDLLDVLTRQLSEFAARDADPTAARFAELTPAEMRVCQLIRQGLSSKQIAGSLHIAPATVSRHREHIRRKLGLTGKSANLERYLQEKQTSSAPGPAPIGHAA